MKILFAFLALTLFAASKLFYAVLDRHTRHS